MRCRRLSPLGVLIVLALATPATAADFHCAAGDVPCLVSAINSSNQNGQENTIQLDAGTYPLTTVADATEGGTGLPVISGSVSIRGAGPTATTIVRPLLRFQSPLFRIFNVSATGRLLLAGVTVTGGSPGGGLTAGGGAVLSRGAVTILDSVISQNTANADGAIQIHDGSLNLIDSSVTNNLSLSGIVGIGRFTTPASGNASVFIIRSTISNNSCCPENAGDIVSIARGWTATIRDSTLTGNSGEALGGVISAGGTFGGDVTITNTTIAVNSSARGAIVSGRAVRIANSTITGNGGGIRGQGPLLLHNTIVSGNDSPAEGDCRDRLSPSGDAVVISLGHNLFGNPSGCGAVASDLTGDPGFRAFVDSGRPGHAYFSLRADSQANDAGDSAACPETDQRGLARNVDGNGDGIRGCDIGAVEFYPVVNEALQLEGVQSFFIKPANLGFVDPRASAGAYRITAFFKNNGPDICHVAFDVAALQGPAGTNPTLLTNAGELLGGQGAAITAASTGAPLDLLSGSSVGYQFTIGVQQRTGINFMVNALGDATGGPCAP